MLRFFDMRRVVCADALMIGGVKLRPRAVGVPRFRDRFRLRGFAYGAGIGFYARGRAGRIFRDLARVPRVRLFFRVPGVVGADALMIGRVKLRPCAEFMSGRWQNFGLLRAADAAGIDFDAVRFACRRGGDLAVVPPMLFGFRVRRVDGAHALMAVFVKTCPRAEAVSRRWNAGNVARFAAADAVARFYAVGRAGRGSFDRPFFGVLVPERGDGVADIGIAALCAGVSRVAVVFAVRVDDLCGIFMPERAAVRESFLRGRAAAVAGFIVGRGL